jgi:hypothetical protein
MVAAVDAMARPRSEALMKSMVEMCLFVLEENGAMLTVDVMVL